MKQRKGMKKVISLLMVITMLVGEHTISNAATETEAEAQFRSLYLKLLETGDNSVQDITDLNLPYMTCRKIVEDVKKNEGFLPYHCYNEKNWLELDSVPTIEDTPYLYKFHLSVNDTGFEECYAAVKQMIAEEQTKLDEKMTDLDKLLWFHEYVVDKLYYLNTNKTAEHMGGPSLVQGYGVCEGYATALAMFLKAENITCELVDGGKHEWLEVKIDGKWYHVDPTWDDTTASRLGTHYFLMRNDEEFLTTLSRLHEEWQINITFVDETVDVTSDSTEYTDWYVHDVWDRMYYYDGYWYYVLNDAVRKNNIQGSDETVICEGKNLAVTGINDGVLTYTQNGVEEKLDLKEETMVPTETITAVPTQIAEPTQVVEAENVTPTSSQSILPENTPAPKPTAVQKAPKKGTILTDKNGKAKYKVLSSGVENGTVEYVKPTDKKAKNITIPAKVTINGITYKVVSVGKNALKNNKQVTKVTIGSNVKKIGKQAFYGCKKLKTITIKSKKLTAKNVGGKAFKGIHSKAIIKVPKEKVKTYKKMLKAKGIGTKVKVKK